MRNLTLKLGETAVVTFDLQKDDVHEVHTFSLWSSVSVCKRTESDKVVGAGFHTFSVYLEELVSTTETKPVWERRPPLQVSF